MATAPDERGGGWFDFGEVLVDATAIELFKGDLDNLGDTVFEAWSLYSSSVYANEPSWGVFNIEAMGVSSTGRYRYGPSHDCDNGISVTVLCV